ncbi:MAG: TIGR04086 family membrane protein [Oscillospiraceae bacterium]
MNKQKNHTGYINKKIKSIVIAVLIGEAVIVALLFLFSFLIIKVDVPLFLTNIFVATSAVIGGFIAGIISGRLIRKNGIVYGLIAGTIITITILIINIVFFNLELSLISALKYSLIIISSSVGGILGVNLKIHNA